MSCVDANSFRIVLYSTSEYCPSEEEVESFCPYRNSKEVYFYFSYIGRVRKISYLGVDLKEFASTYNTQTEKVNTEDQVKTAGSPGENGPNLLVQKCFHQTGLRWEEEICNIQHYNTRNGYVHRGHKGWRQDAVDKRSEGSRKGQANYLWIPRRSGHIYKGPSPLGGTLSHKHSPTPSLTGSPRHQWRNRLIQLPGRHQLQQHPQ